MMRDALVGRIADVLRRANAPDVDELIRLLSRHLPERLAITGDPVVVMTKFHADLLHRLSDPLIRSGIADAEVLIRLLQLNLMART